MLGSASENIKSGTRVCSIHRNKEEQLSVLVDFFIAGLKNNEKCFAIIGDEVKLELFKTLLKVGVDIAKCNAWGQFAFSSPEEAYLKSGKFDPQALLFFLRKIESEALLDGFDGLRFSGEAKSYYGKAAVIDRLTEYGEEANEFLRKSRTVILTQYEEGFFKSGFLRDVVYTSSKFFLYGKLCENKYYLPPEKFSALDRSKLLSYEELVGDLFKK